MATKDWQSLTEGEKRGKIFISQDEMEMKDETSMYKFIEDTCDKFCDKCECECQIDTEAQSCKFCNKCEWHYCALLSGASRCRPKTRKDKKTGYWKEIKNK